MKPSIHRPTIAKIDLEAIRHNVAQVSQHIAANKAIFAVVKADAYGHGACAVAQALQNTAVSGFCVATLDEALELRQAGIQQTILIMGLTRPEDAPLMIAHNISATVSEASWLNQAQRYIQQGQLAIHLALDTGMSRLGLKDEASIKQFENELNKTSAFILEGVFTHFATADGEDDNKVYKQYNRFKTLVACLEKRPKYVHLSNSAIAFWHEQFETDIVRLGIGMYGLNPSDIVLDLPYALKPALSWETEIALVKRLNKGESVSYGAKYIAKEDEWIAVLPVGYADGWRRDLGGQFVYVDGYACAILGVVCMDQFMIRLPKAYPIGTKVELIGEHNSASQLAVNIGTIGYEILCGISERVPRVYIEKVN